MEEVLIFSYKIARDLIRSGFAVRDIRPNHDVKNGTVIVFDRSDAIKIYLKDKWGVRIKDY